MTKEEATKKLADIIFNAAKNGYMPYDTNDETCAMNIAKKHIDEFYTSLPSNLDEAAEKEIERFCSDILNVDIIWARMPLTKRFGLQMAKFGAEWMQNKMFSLRFENEPLDSAARNVFKEWIPMEVLTIDGIDGGIPLYNQGALIMMFDAGAEWMAGQGWIDDGSMPPETKYEEDTMQGHREWTESKPVLAWDSMYGPRVDITKNGKWISEQRGGYTGQICHGIIAWMPIPKYNEKQ